MVIVNTIAARDKVKNKILSVCQPDGKWKVYVIGDEALLPHPPVEVPARIIPAYDFRDKFTPAELSAINNKAYVVGDANVQLLLLKVFTATEGVNLDSQDTIDGVNYLAYIGVITAARKTEILG